jgi:hypothetical protein
LIIKVLFFENKNVRKTGEPKKQNLTEKQATSRTENGGK